MTNEYIKAEQRLYRLPHRGIISGVCAGIARYLGTEPLWVRLGAAAGLVLVPGITCIAYIAAVFILPRKTY